MNIIKGFSTQERFFEFSTIIGVETAKRDLMNHLYTKRGERLGNPNFGSIIYTLLFEQMDPSIINLVEDDINRIVNTDPRWSLINMNTTLKDHSITCLVVLNYLPTTTVEELYLEFTQRA